MLNLFTAVAETVTTSEATGQTQELTILPMIIMLVAMFALMYFVTIRPQKKKEKAVKKMLDALKPGDRILTIGGFYGTVTAVKDDTITLALGQQQNTVVIARWAVRSVEDAPLENDVEPEI